MKYLAICIPTYNRINKLQRLVRTLASQIEKFSLENMVEICINDDCSQLDPSELIEAIRAKYPQIEICYGRNSVNKGMDYNFLQSVLMAESEYCWIIGNDDLPVETGIFNVIEYLKGKNNKIDFVVTPFDVYDENDNVRGTVEPLKQNTSKSIVFDTKNQEEYEKLVLSVQHNSGMFGFLSNTVFRREYWINNKEYFQDKLNTLFIQMYMNIEALQNGAVYAYWSKKIIRNYADDDTNKSSDRICRILIGLDGVVEYFFEGKMKVHLKKVMTDAYINGLIWEQPNGSPYKNQVEAIVSAKNLLYQKYYVLQAEQKKIFEGEKVIIYGAGDYGRQAYKILKNYYAQVIGVADSDERKIGIQFEEFQIISINEMKKVFEEQNPYVIVANHFYLCDMIKRLRKEGIDKIKIIN